MAAVSKNAAKVFNGFKELSYEDRTALMEVFKEFQDNISKRKEISEKLFAEAGVSLGPTSGNGCPCCGK